MSLRSKIIIGVVGICLIWGSTWSAIKIGLEELPPFLSAGLRFAVATFCIYVLIRIRNIQIPTTMDFYRIAFQIGLGSFIVPFALTYWSQQYVPSSLASVLFAIYPFMVALFSYFRLKNEQVSFPKIMGILFGFFGIFIIFYGDITLGSPLILVAMIALLVSASIQAYVLVSIKKHGTEINTFALTYVGMATGSVVLMLLSLLFERSRSVHFSVSSVGSIFYLGTFGSVITFATYFWLVRHIHPVILSLTSFVTPILAILIGHLFLQEQLPPMAYAGSGFVLIGILIANVSDVVVVLRRKVASWNSSTEFHVE
jgi:drug/metabolite transporter (DMT)-like permease